MKRRWLLASLLSLLFATHGAADHLEATRDLVVRAQPDGDSAVVTRVESGTLLVLLDETQHERGYYRAGPLDRSWEGWVYRNRVRRRQGLAAGAGAFRAGVTEEGTGERLRGIELYSDDCPFGCPRGDLEERAFVVRRLYTLQNNGGTKFADWVAYRVLPENLEGPSRPRNWRADPWLRPGTTLTGRTDYNGASKDSAMEMGHQAPLATFKGSERWSESNYLSNIAPQRIDLNKGLWKVLEDRERRFVTRGGGPLFVMTGPIYQRAMVGLPNARRPHRVPSGYWKVLVAGDPARPRDLRVAAFLFEQDTPRTGDVREHEASVDAVEQVAGLDLLWGLEDELEAALEAGVGGAWLWEEQAEGERETTGGFEDGDVSTGGAEEGT